MRLRNISPEPLKFRSNVIYKSLRNFTYAFRKKIDFQDVPHELQEEIMAVSTRSKTINIAKSNDHSAG